MLQFEPVGGLWKAKSRVVFLGKGVIAYVMAEDQKEPTTRQIEILTSVERFGSDLSGQFASHAREYWRRIDWDVHLAEEGVLIDRDNIERHYSIESLIIPEIRQCEENLFLVHADCDWEEEHGMQAVVQDGRIIACGEKNSLPWGGLWKRIISESPANRERLLRQMY